MTDAIKCNRCKNYTTNIADCEKFRTNDDLCNLLSRIKKRYAFDLCPICLEDLVDILEAWMDMNLKR